MLFRLHLGWPLHIRRLKNLNNNLLTGINHVNTLVPRTLLKLANTPTLYGDVLKLRSPS